ncbi:SMR family transporter [Nocardioides salsibiostraticola]
MSDLSRGRILLATAIGLEVMGTMSLRLADGFTEPIWTALVVTGYVSSIAVFARALSLGMGLGVAYATLTGVGLIAAALASAVVFDERLGLLDAGGLLLVLMGVLLLQRPGQGSAIEAGAGGP